MIRKSKKTFLQRGHTHGQQAHEKIFKIANYQRNANQNMMEDNMTKRLFVYMCVTRSLCCAAEMDAG